MEQTDFSSLALDAALLKNLSTLGYENMTPIQAKSLPVVLAGQDIIAQGQTGSGKTAAFGLGLLNALEVKRFRIQSLVLCPTRELADQVATEIRKLGRSIHNIKVLTLCGGQPFGPQIGSLEHGAHIVVGTPGRIEEHLRKGNLVLDDLTNLVLDEADRMLDMGFQDTIDAILDKAPINRQTMLFSATYPEQIQSIAERVMKQPVMVEVKSTHDDSSIEQYFYKVRDNDERLTALQILLLKYEPESAVIFCITKKETQELANFLKDAGFSAQALHGDLEQKQRDQALVQFSNKSVSILVATDVAARGLDIDNLDAVINYHISRDNEVHTHRIGRTGRAGQKGLAFNLFTDKEEYRVVQLTEYLGCDFETTPLPPETLLDKAPYYPEMVTLQIDGGKKQKVRAGDIVGALTGQNGIDGKKIGKIQLFDNWAYVAVAQKDAKAALKKLTDGKLKGRSFRVRRLR